MRLDQIPNVSKQKRDLLLEEGFETLEHVAYSTPMALDRIDGLSGQKVLDAQKQIPDFPASRSIHGVNKRAVCYCRYCGEQTTRGPDVQNSLQMLTDHMNRCEAGPGRVHYEEHQK